MTIQEILNNKNALLETKKSVVHKSEPISFKTQEGFINKNTNFATELFVEAIGNTAYWCDKHDDVLLPTSWDKTISNPDADVVHLKDHNHSTEGLIGEIVAVWSESKPWRELNVEKEGDTQVLAFSSNVLRVYDEATFVKYQRGLIKQHSIGMIYKDVVLAVNEPTAKEEYSNWLKYIPHVANRSEVEAKGYMYVVKEIELLEISAVLFGSNKLTPTTAVKQSLTKEEVFKNLISNIKIKI